tara:strand:- start:20567 stop:21724 length:1158 start_codon:yes stop_codon:yes gene_type:complete
MTSTSHTSIFEIMSSPMSASIKLNHFQHSIINWLTSHVVEILIATGIAILLYLVMTLVRGAVSKLRHRGETDIGFATLIGRTAARTTHLFMALAAARLVVGFANPPEPIFNVIRFAFTVVAVLQGALWAREFILGLIERKTGDSVGGETLSNAMGLIRVLVTFALFAVAAVMVLDNLGVNVTGLVAGLGIGGIAIGLAAQGIFSDLFAALSIIFDKPFRQGDTIQYETTIATVEHIGLKSTRLRSIEGEAKIISNAKLLEMEITNYADIMQRRYALPVGVIYQTPPEKAARVPEILRDVIEGAGAEFVRAGFLGFGASSLDYECFFVVHERELNDAVAMRHKIGMAVLERFAGEGLEFAYPTQTTFTAAPDGTMIYPFTRPQDVL